MSFLQNPRVPASAGTTNPGFSLYSLAGQATLARQTQPRKIAQPDSQYLRFTAGEIDDGRRLHPTTSGVERQFDLVFQTRRNRLAVVQRQIVPRQLQRRADYRLPQFLQQIVHHRMVGNANADRLARWMGQAARHLSRRFENERIGAGSCQSQQPVGGIVDLGIGRNLGQVAAQQTQVVAFVDPAQTPDAVDRRLVVELADQRVAGVGGSGHETALRQRLRRTAQQPSLRVLRMNRKKLRHPAMIEGMAIYRLGNRIPQIHPSAYIHDSAVVIGDVVIGAHASIWPGVVLRGDREPVVVGEETNIQDGSVLHTEMGSPVVLGNRVTIGHMVMLHGCTVGDGSLVGIQAVLLNDSVVGRHCLVGAAALLTEGKRVPDNSLVIGAPGRVLRDLRPEEIADLDASATAYVGYAEMFRSQLQRIG